jgi:hypothetical protein
MTAVGDGLGRVFNVIHEATGLNVPLTQGTAVSFVSFLAAGTQALTFTQTDSTGTNSETDLDVFVAATDAHPENLNSRIHAGPGVGGGWVEKAPTADNVFTNNDATNDTVVITIRAEQLTDGYDSVQCTAATGTCVAILHDLSVQRRPGNLKSSMVA